MKYTKPQITLREAIAKEEIGSNILLDMSIFTEDYFGGEGEEQED